MLLAVFRCRVPCVDKLHLLCPGHHKSGARRHGRQELQSAAHRTWTNPQQKSFCVQCAAVHDCPDMS